MLLLSEAFMTEVKCFFFFGPKMETLWLNPIVHTGVLTLADASANRKGEEAAFHNPPLPSTSPPPNIPQYLSKIIGQRPATPLKVVCVGWWWCKKE